VAQTLPAGSSAGGEQPKFLAILQDGQHVIVKFTPSLRSPGGQRWSDLLDAEHLAARTLTEHGIPAATTQVVRSAERTYLVSRRFDRVGVAGRRHVVAIGKVHQAFVQGAYRNWAQTTAALARAHRLSAGEAEAALLARDFGRLIGNTDMHAGNLGLFVEAGDIKRGGFHLAPVYDMLPMRYRPNALHGSVDDYAPFEPETGLLDGRAASMAADFWERVAATDATSSAMRQLASEMLGRVARDRPGRSRADRPAA
jgi:serine/threonine protein kinase HipA of HipAB toxin-antitoxin module